MKTKKQRDIKRKYKYALFVVTFSLFTLFSGVYPLIDWKVKERPKPIWYNPNLADYLYEDNINQTSYSFNAMNESYIMCEIQNTDYTTFTFNSSVYNVSYGLNIFPIDFGNQNQSYSIEISQDDANNDVFDWLCVQPLFIKEDIIEVNLTSTTDISFYAGGMVSILVQPNFSYNWLYLEVDGVVINNIYNTDSYPEVSSGSLIAFQYEGEYIQYDLDLIPDSHQLKFKGNGTIDYKIIATSDWDGDYLSDAEEIQMMDYDSRYNPTEPIVWGYFEMGDFWQMPVNYINETAMFRFYIPETYSGQGYVYFSLHNGLMSDIKIDEEENYLTDQILKADYLNYGVYRYLGILSSGFHLLTYKFSPSTFMDISFFIDGREILILEKSDLRDSDGDGLKNVEEEKIGSDFLNPDTDYDGLRDNFDGSPTSSLTLGNDEICQVVFSHNSTQNTIIDISIDRPDNPCNVIMISSIIIFNGV